MTPEPHQALLCMKEVIVAGWTRDQLRTPDGKSYCLIGAGVRTAQLLGEPLGDFDYAPMALRSAPATYAALSLICEVVGSWNVTGLAYWNDDPARTKTEVVDAIDRALIKSAANRTPVEAREEVPA